jgi:hypothetical protein
MMLWEAIGGLVLVIAMLALSHYFFWRAGRDDAYEDGRASAYAEILGERDDSDGEAAADAFAEMRRGITAAGRHRASQPRARSSPAPGANPEPSPAHAIAPPRSGYRDSLHWPPGWPPGCVVTTAAAIPPVILPRPGTRIPLRTQAAPGKRGASDSAVLPRIRLSPGATTGDIRAIGDQIVDAIQAGELG